jgi:hypothetical protein
MRVLGEGSRLVKQLYRHGAMLTEIQIGQRHQRMGLGFLIPGLPGQLQRLLGRGARLGSSRPAEPRTQPAERLCTGHAGDARRHQPQGLAQVIDSLRMAQVPSHRGAGLEQQGRLCGFPGRVDLPQRGGRESDAALVLARGHRRVRRGFQDADVADANNLRGIGQRRP